MNARPLRFAGPDIARSAREQLVDGLPRLFLRQAAAELRVTWGRHLRFRSSDNAAAARAYGAMTVDEFDGVNARQRWANWRVIPRSLDGRLPDAPCRALDLCSGTGHLTQVLAYYLPEGSEILGLEFNPSFVETAARRAYRRRDGGAANARFRVQSVLETFRDERGEPLPDGGVGLINSCGALGIHFDPPALGRIAAEAARVLRSGGLATLDCGAPGRTDEAAIAAFRGAGFQVLGSARSCFLDRYVHVGFRKS